MSRRANWMASTSLLGALMAGVFIRLLRLGAKPLWLDEVLSVRAASVGLQELTRGTVERYHPPLYFLLLSGWLRAGTSDGFVRLLSVVAGSAAVLLTGWLARELFGRRVAVTATWLSAASPLLVWYAQEARDYSLLVAAVLLGLVGLALCLPRPRPHSWALFVLGTIIGLYTHYVGALAPILQAVLAVGLVSARRAVPSTLGLMLLGWVVAGLAYLPWVRTPAAQAFLLRLRSDGLFLDVLNVGRGYLPPTLAALVQQSPVSLAAVAGLVIGLLVLVALGVTVTVVRRYAQVQKALSESGSARILLIVLFFAMLVVSVIPRGYTAKRYALVLLPALLIFYATVWPWDSTSQRVIAALVGLSLAASFLNVLVIPKAQWDRAADFVREHEEVGDVVVLSPAYMTLTYGYYAGENPPTSVVRGSGISDVDKTLSGLREKYARVWYVFHTTDVGRHQAAIGHWLTENAGFVSRTRFYRVDVLLYSLE